MNKTAVIITAMVLIGWLAALALFKGMDGAVLTGIIATISGLGVFTLGRRSIQPKAPPNGAAPGSDNPSTAP